jgi:hypothetical protein
MRYEEEVEAVQGYVELWRISRTYVLLKRLAKARYDIES